MQSVINICQLRKFPSTKNFDRELYLIFKEEKILVLSKLFHKIEKEWTPPNLFYVGIKLDINIWDRDNWNGKL